MTEKVKIEIPTETYVKAKSANGGASRHSGDLVASTLAGMTLEQVQSIAAEVIDVPAEDLAKKYEHLNIGQRRMNLGNRIRGAVNKMNKAEEGSGDKYLLAVADPFIVRNEEGEAA